MSIRTMSKVWESSQHSGSNLLMLLAVADFSDDDGVAFPAVQKLAKKCRMSKRNAQDRLRELSESGELTILKNQGPPPKYPNLFKVNLDALGVKPHAPVQYSVSRGEVQRMEGVQPTAPKPSVTINDPSREAQASPASPSGRKRGSKTTFTVWAKAELAAGRKLLSGWEPLQRYMDDTGLPVSMVNLAWARFKDRYTSDPNYTHTVYVDWRRAFLNAIEGNWFRLWFIDGDNQYQLTTTGTAAQLKQDAIDKRTETTT